MKKLSVRKKKWIERTVANDRTDKRFLYNRFYLFALLVLLQIAGAVALWYAFVYDSRIGASIQALIGVSAIASVLYIVGKDERPSLKLSWIMLILAFPIFGVPFYVFFGAGLPTKRMRRKLGKAQTENHRRMVELFGGKKPLVPESRAEGISHYLQTYVDCPAFSDGEVFYYSDGETLFSAMKEALQKAEKFIFLEYFIIAHGKMWGEILQILLEKAAQGVKIRVVYDDFGCMTTLPPDYDCYLESLHGNIKAFSFNQVVPVFDLRMNNRDHRKILVVDGKVAFTGGVNLADEYIGEKRRFGYWKDSGVKITGGGVHTFTRLFLDMWNGFRKDKEDIGAYVKTQSDAALPPADYALNATLPPSNEKKPLVIQPYGDSPLDEKSVSEHVYTDAINRAVKYVYIFTPYLLPGDTLRLALVRAAERGVDVRVVTPGIPDKKAIYRLTRANYGVLLSAGVKIYEYTPGFIHSKSIVIDDEAAVVGTVNFDYRSLYMHFENGVYFSDCRAVAALKRDCEETFAVSKLCTKENTKRSVFGKLFDSILRLFESLM